jgi:hypothetical protein
MQRLLPAGARQLAGWTREGTPMTSVLDRVLLVVATTFVLAMTLML